MSFTAGSTGGLYRNGVRTISNSYGLDAGIVGYSGKLLFSDIASNLNTHYFDNKPPYISVYIWKRAA